MFETLAPLGTVAPKIPHRSNARSTLVPRRVAAEWESDTETLDVDDMVMLDDRLDFTYILIPDSDEQPAWVSPVWLNDA